MLAKERLEAKLKALAEGQGDEPLDGTFHADPGVDDAVNEIAWASW